MVVFGGAAASGVLLNDVWVLTNANGTEPTSPSWIQLFPTGTPPPVRDVHSAVYDANDNRMIVFGGGNACLSGCIWYNDVWELTNANGTEPTTPSWIQLFPTGTLPQGRDGHYAVYNANDNRMIIFGGQISLSDGINDTWVLTNANGISGNPEWVHRAR